MKKLLAVCFFILFVFILNSVYAIPQKISFQGVLKDSAGNLVTANKDITFRIYDVTSGGTSLWGETQTVSVEAGLYTVELGSVTAIPLTLFNGDTRYLGIEVDGAQLSPRIVVLSVPYAYRANYADTAGSAGASSGSVLFCPVTVQTTSSANAIYIQSSAAGSAPSNYVGVISLEASGSYSVGGLIISRGANGIGLATVATGDQSKAILGSILSGVQGIGVDASANHALAYAIHGKNNSGVGIYGEGQTAGYFKADETGGMGVYGRGNKIGGSFEGYGVSSLGVSGYSSAYDGIGGYFKSDGGGGIGVFGSGASAGGSFESTATAGSGVFAQVSGTVSKAVYGWNTNTDSVNYGGYFQSDAAFNNAAGVYGVANGSSGKNYGVRGATLSPDGYAGYFDGGLGVKIPSSTVPTGSSTEEGTLRAWGGTLYVYLGAKWNRISMEAL